MTHRTLAEGLALPRSGYVIFKDYASQLEYVRSCEEIWEKGMYVELGAYQCHAFMDFRFVHDPEWQIICDYLKGAGVPSLQEEWQRTFAPVEAMKEDVPVKKKRAARKPAVKKTTAKSAKKPATKKTVSKTKPAKKTSVAKKPEKKTITTKKTVSKPKATKTVTTKKTTVKKTTAKTAESKPIAKKKTVSKKKSK
ncbi:MAG: hypothetical protein ACKOGC_02740 [Anaerolineae bacterium]